MVPVASVRGCRHVLFIALMRRMTDSFVRFKALMEYHCSDDKTVASRIFEKGLDLFGDEIEFVLRYLGFLISINDANSKLHETFLFFNVNLIDLHRCTGLI
jgi:hypothetical protein